MEERAWQRLAGTWATEATHPGLPGALITGRSDFEWLGAAAASTPVGLPIPRERRTHRDSPAR